MMIVRQGVVPAASGLGLGLLAGGAARLALAALFPGGRAGRGFDVEAFLLVATAVAAVTCLAAFVPGRRASRINPTQALRYE
jgi:ABC-type antimicrobial peptide transport system permease subunit